MTGDEFRVDLPPGPPDLNPRAARALLRLLRHMEAVGLDDPAGRKGAPTALSADGTAPAVPYETEAAG